ncbi:ubiquitin-protein ligase [Wolfiporia cocos MD-104 SS10]|uniref:Anaphase-promoting complex subunit 2 n=1 Tax=Wolfiporia cocos (strain MD-104) TaxID=742152 RepID=A0A2H3JCZ3_WOLCO|nr:ubiquitin-protein ligase [Wolfiporia cocos MD-104 SS10]
MATENLHRLVAARWQNSFTRLNQGQPGITGLLAFSEAWTLATDFLHPCDLADLESRKRFDMNKVRSSTEILSKSKMLPLLLENFLEDMRKNQHLITRDVEAFMARYEETADPQYISQLVFRLCEWYSAWCPIPELGQTILHAYMLNFQTHVFSVLPPSFSNGFKDLVSRTFDISRSSTPPPWLNVPSVFQTPDNPSRADYALWAAFEQLGLLERYESLISSVCYEYIESHILETCTGKWDEQMLKPLRDWMTDNIVPWMLMPYARGAKSANEARSMLQGVGSRFDFHVCKTLSDLRTREIFDIIVDYPDSVPALQDLKECLQRVDQRAQLVQTLRKANRKRLLHPGADTKDILTQYVSIIRCLRIVDPPGVLLFKVADPIRKYLRERSDTIRCIVASLVGDGESGDSLVDENEPIQPLQQMQVEDYTDPSWEPEPIDAGPDFRTNKPSDVISTLVSIYDSKDLFVKELQVLLAQRLLAITDGNFERERRNIEILKIRFGEAALQVCEVMLRDMTDSKRIDQHVQSQQDLPLQATIISRHFWPPLQAGNFVMPGQFKEIQDEYAKEFNAFKPDKKLRWLPHLGTITLDVVLKDRTINACVPPLDAAFLELFSTKDRWTVDELIAAVGSVDRTAALKALSTWVDIGILKEEEDNQYRLLEVAEAESDIVHKPPPTRPVPAAEEVPTALTVQQQQAEQMRVFWKFIEGMLTNLGALSLDRIQTMLKIAPNYNRTIEQLAAFMEAARREGLVTVKDGMWKLNRQ